MSGQVVYVAEYSASHDAFHVQHLAEALESNLQRALRKDRSNDWVAVAVGDQESVGRVLDLIREGQARLLSRRGQ